MQCFRLKSVRRQNLTDGLLVQLKRPLMAKIKQAAAAAARQAGKLEMPGTSIAEMTLSGFSGYYYHFYGCREPRRARRSMDRLITRLA